MDKPILLIILFICQPDLSLKARIAVVNCLFDE